MELGVWHFEELVSVVVLAEVIVVVLCGTVVALTGNGFPHSAFFSSYKLAYTLGRVARKNWTIFLFDETMAPSKSLSISGALRCESS